MPILLLLFFLFSWFAIDRTLNGDGLIGNSGDDDPQAIVIDEALGQAVVLWLVAAHSLTDYVLCFVFLPCVRYLQAAAHRFPRASWAPLVAGYQ